ncbi:MAG: aspartate aminotransferase family protein [Bacteroides sp.]|nr:aspartate aminotransferase family protein [Ruminococcus flavefaciens]MCM1555346.1 aspartate aminotransferase family protein [Bacteroides sp.]
MQDPNRFLFKKYIAQSSDFEPFSLDIEKSEGIYLWDKAGKKYIDFISGICVNNVGHRNPVVLKAIEQQMQKYLHVMVYGEFIQQPQLDLAQALCANLPPQLQKIFLLNSGSEAIEGAMKLARLYNHRSQIVSFSNSYHGSTMGAMSVLGNPPIRQRFDPLLPEHLLLEYNNTAQLENITEKTCCVVAEVIQSGGGMREATPGFMQALRERCTKTGTLLIFDEIQSGFGRTGKLFAFEHYGVVPDILCLAKGMGGGMPIGAFIASPELMALLDNEHPLMGHASTFGGHPLSCASSLAALRLILSPEVLPMVESKGQRIRRHLQELPQVRSVSGKGLFLAAHFDSEEATAKVQERCMTNGFITFWLLFNHTALALTPPLTSTNEEIDLGMEIFKRSVREAGI